MNYFKKYVFNKCFWNSKTILPYIFGFLIAVAGMIFTPGETDLSAVPLVTAVSVAGFFVGWIVGKLIEHTDYSECIS